MNEFNGDKNKAAVTKQVKESELKSWFKKYWYSMLIIFIVSAVGGYFLAKSQENKDLPKKIENDKNEVDYSEVDDIGFYLDCYDIDTNDIIYGVTKNQTIECQLSVHSWSDDIIKELSFEIINGENIEILDIESDYDFESDEETIVMNFNKNRIQFDSKESILLSYTLKVNDTTKNNELYTSVNDIKFHTLADYYYNYDDISFGLYSSDSIYIYEGGKEGTLDVTYSPYVNVELLQRYHCSNNECKYINYYDEYLLIDDGSLIIYNYKTNKKIVLDYAYEEIWYTFVGDDSPEGIIINSSEISEYFSLKLNKSIVKYRDNDKEDVTLFYDEELHSLIVNKENETDNYVQMLDLNGESLKVDLNKLEKIGATDNYYAYCNLSGDWCNNVIFDQNGSALFEGESFDSGDFDTDDNGNLIILRDNKFEIYDKDYKLIKTSKEHNNLEIVVKGKYIVLIDELNNLKLIDIDENELATFTTMTEDKSFYDFLSGWYEVNKKAGVYLVVEDPSVTSEEIYNANPDEFDEEYKELLTGGYEYYYIPETGESGKIPTYIGGYAKPVLYLYPEEDNTNITVSFANPDLLTTTYPKFNRSWNVTANQNGDLYDKNGKYYYGLYWEESGSSDVDFSEGFYVTKENAIEFLEEKLSIIGLSDRERNEFIMYWLPILEKNKQSLVYFELTEEREAYNKLEIYPKPDSLLRMAIHVKKVAKKTYIKEQKLETFERSGFTAVEWGGVIH